jgi:hypothetical protein
MKSFTFQPFLRLTSRASVVRASPAAGSVHPDAFRLAEAAVDHRPAVGWSSSIRARPIRVNLARARPQPMGRSSALASPATSVMNPLHPLSPSIRPISLSV